MKMPKYTRLFLIILIVGGENGVKRHGTVCLPSLHWAGAEYPLINRGKLPFSLVWRVVVCWRAFNSDRAVTQPDLLLGGHA